MDFTPVSPIRPYGLACDGGGEESSFELTLRWVAFENEEAQVLKTKVRQLSTTGGWEAIDFGQDAIKDRFLLEKGGLTWHC